MATIQIRNIPDDAYEALRQQAHDAGQSLQSYMREQVTGLARSRARWAEAVAEWEAQLAASPPKITREQIIRDLDEVRR